MRLGLKYTATLLSAAVIATALGAAAVAAAAQGDSQQSDQSCDQQGASQYVCEGPGNAQVSDPPSATNYYSILG
jgi:hypothetical protein